MTQPPAPSALDVAVASVPERSRTSHQKNLGIVILVLASLSAIFNVCFFRAWLPLALEGRNDFQSFYAAGVIVNQGGVRQLYDQGLQYSTQKRIAPATVASQGALYYYHPPLELAFYALLARLPYRIAYTVGTAVNLAILVAIILLLPAIFPRLKQLFGPFLFLVLLGFWPVLATIWHGQDSLLLLLLFLLAARDIKAGRMFRAGCLLGLTVFKFQYVLPLAALALLTGRRRLFAGIAASASVCGLASLAALGWRGLSMEIGMILQLNRGVTDAAVQVHNKIFPTTMLNLRGLVYLGLSSVAPERVIIGIVALVSLVLFLWAITKTRHLDELSWLAVSTLVAIAVSYHCQIQDGVLFLLPVSSLLQTEYRHSGWPLLAISPFLIPALSWIFTLRHQEAILVLPVVIFLFAALARIPRAGPAAAAA